MFCISLLGFMIRSCSVNADVRDLEEELDRLGSMTRNALERLELDEKKRRLIDRRTTDAVSALGASVCWWMWRCDPVRNEAVPFGASIATLRNQTPHTAFSFE